MAKLYKELIKKCDSFERVAELTQAQAQTLAQTQAQTQARPSQRAPIAAGGLKWQSYIRSLLGNVTDLKG